MSHDDPSAVVVTDHWAQHPRGRLFVRRWCPPRTGSGDAAPPAPVLMFHDSLGSVALWRDFPARLAARLGRDVVAYDRLGFGLSDPRCDRLSTQFVAEEAASVLPRLREALGIGRFVAFGHSVGGGMAVHAAAQWADDCEALVTVAAQAFVEERTVLGIEQAREMFRDPAQRERLARHHGERAEWVLQAWIGTWLSPEFASWSLSSVLPQVRCPALVLHGELDEYGSARHPETLGRLCGGPARVEILAGTAHVPHRERPDEVLDLVAEFLQPAGPAVQAGRKPSTDR